MKISYSRKSFVEDDNRTKTIHIYPTVSCNKNCLHCYSNSGSFQNKGEIKAENYYPFLKYARRKGFNTLSISGGEPFLYSDLENLVFASKEIGLDVHITTNGSLLHNKKIKRLLPIIDFIQISLDGAPDLHNELRNDTSAFNEFLKGLQILNKYAQSFGIIHTLTSRSWDSLLWMTEFASENGASRFDVHPLEMSGRAVLSNLYDYELDQLTLHKVFYLHNYLQNKYKDRLEINIDVLHKSFIEQHPEAVCVYPDISEYAEAPLSYVLKDIVIDENGDIIPIGYGFSTQFIISNLHFFDPSFDVFREYMKENGKLLKNYFMQSYWNMVNNKNKEYFHPSEYLVRNSWEHKLLEFA